MKKYKTSIFIFRRDLRLDDNITLLQALSESEKVISCFIFDPRQVGISNSFKSKNCIQFMIESLKNLDEQLKQKKGKLYIFNGIAEKVVERLIKQETIEAIYVNADYTPFSIKRDNAIKRICLRQKIKFISCDDLLLNAPEKIKKQDGTPYSIFSAFYKRSIRETIAIPKICRKKNFYIHAIRGSQTPMIYKKFLKKENPNLHVNGGTQEAKKLIGNITRLKSYTKTKDFPAIETSNLSAHLKFGTISIRQTYHSIGKKLGKDHPLIKQLYWRDFFTHIAYNSPFVFGQAYYKKYNKLWWSKSKTNFKKWCNGKTGFPVVDAGMRQLNKTGFMHNRVRMIAASFLTKDLHINWTWGEKYFAQQLVDYDPSVNNGNWQWSASTGCDAQPYFRIFNPWLQQKKFDPECMYIKKWVPELKNIDNQIIHSWFKDTHDSIHNYPTPMVDHAIESHKAKMLYKEITNKQ
ncbi:deoxyribodipyrimidine photo-lyase [Candidatus Dependentiae bacterium]|nr:deoxyribodipyrimidine photo-lyase [Candidatus Dependentiae bacterium]